MQIINEQYKVVEEKDTDLFGTTYIVEDIHEGNLLKHLRTISFQKETKGFIEFMKYNFYDYSSYFHPNLIKIYFFNRINLIDYKQVAINQFYYAYDYFDSVNAFEYCKKKDLDLILDLAAELCSAIKFLHLRGFLLCGIMEDDLGVVKEGDEYHVKISSLPYPKGINKKVILDKRDMRFMAPETENDGGFSFASDIYTIGAIIFHMINGSESYNERSKGQNSHPYRSIMGIIEKCMSEEPGKRYQTVDGIIGDINSRFKKSYNIVQKEYLQAMPYYRIKPLGRYSLIERVMNDAKGYFFVERSNRITLVLGSEGAGKEDLLVSMLIKAEHEGLRPIKIILNESDFCKFGFLSILIRGIIRYADDDIIDKYLSGINSILPQIYRYGAAASSEGPVYTEGGSETEYVQRLSNFIKEASKKLNIVFLINNIEWIDRDSLELMTKLLHDESDVRVYFIAFMDKKAYLNNDETKEYCNKFREMGILDTVTLRNFSLEDTAEYIRLILGMDHAPRGFARAIYEKTKGSPEKIYNILYMYFSNNSLYVNDKGRWAFDKIDADLLNPPRANDMDTLNNVYGLNSDYNDILRAISIFNSAISSDVIENFVEVKGEKLIGYLNYLSYLNITIVKPDYLGFSFGFASLDLKKSIYESIPTELRRKYHEKASYVLKNIIRDEKRDNLDELIHQMIGANWHHEVREYILDSARYMIENNSLKQAVQFLEHVHSLLAEEGVYEEEVLICNKLAELYERVGEYLKADFYCGVVEKIAVDTGNTNLLIDIYINKYSLMYKLNDKKASFKYLVLSKNLLRRSDYKEGMCEHIIAINRMMLHKRKFGSYIKIIEKALKQTDKDQYKFFYGRLLGICGRFKAYKGRYKEGISELTESIHILEEMGSYRKMLYPLNSMGEIYYYNFNEVLKAKEYFEKCLSISRKVGDAYYIGISYNNLAGIYMIADNNFKALRFYQNSLKNIALTKDKHMKSRIYLNTILANTKIGDYIKAQITQNEMKEEILDYKYSVDLMNLIYQIRSESYYALGDYEKAIQFAQKTMYICTTWGIPENVEVYFVKLLSEIQKSGILDYEKDSSFINKVFKENSYKLGRIACVRLAEIYIEKGRKEQGAGFLNRGLSYASKIDTDILRLRYDYVGALIKEGPERLESLTKLTGLIETTENNEIGWKIYKAIALEYTERGDHREALKYLITSLSYLRKLVHNVPDEYKIEFINSHGRNSIKESLRQTAKLLAPGSPGAESKGEGEYEESTSLNEMDKYFDYTEYRNIYRQNGAEEVSAAISMEANTRVGFLERIQELLNRFSDDERFNLKQIIDLLADMTQAKNAFIAVLQEDESLKVIASYRRYSEIPFYKYVVEQVKQKKESIIVSDVFEYNARKGDILIPNNITAVFCIPIMLPKESEGIEAEQGGERRKHQDQGNNTIAGYIYLDTDSIINNFTLESSCFCITASKIAYVLTDNYNMKAMSTIDKLTKLYTRKYFETKLSNELGHVEREGGQFSIIMADIDKFKSVNDRFGHQKGDEVLQGISSIIMNNVRKGDLCGRYGGEEIIMLLPGTDSKGAYKVAEKIRKKVENSKLMGLNIPLTISLGISSYPEHGTWAKDLVDKADQALYNVKESGRNGSRIYELNMPNSTNRIGRLEGIVSGDLVEDQRKARTLLEILELQRDNNKTIEEKMFSFLGRIIEVSEAHTGGIFLTEEMSRGRIGISRRITRKRLAETEIGEASHNEDIIEKCISSRRGEYQIDWSSYPGIDSLTGMPDWQSVISIPMIDRGKLKGVVYLSVSIKDKEFDAGTYNYIKILSDIMSAVLRKG